MAAARPRFGIGASGPEVEINPFLIRQGQRYTDDLPFPGRLQGAVVRSQIAESSTDYAMPRGDLFPELEFSTRNAPSTASMFGVKGAGKAATIAETSAVMNALIAALWYGYGIYHIEFSAIPFAIWQAIHAAKAQAA